MMHKGMRKEHNIALPMMESVETLNRYGLEVTSGMIVGLDTDTEDTEANLIGFYDTRQRLLSLTAAVAAQDKDIQAAIIAAMEPNGGSSGADKS